jgi:mannose-6-phosphate isomerase-like protein (cupin superfamily)
LLPRPDRAAPSRLGLNAFFATDGEPRHGHPQSRTHPRQTCDPGRRQKTRSPGQSRREKSGACQEVCARQKSRRAQSTGSRQSGGQATQAAHLKDALFKTGLRSYAAYRELGVEKATGGAVQAHVIRLLGKCDPKVVSIPHYHGVQFQFLYMLKGWMIGEYEGAGRVKMTAGSCWIQPPGIRHQVIDYSDGCEMVEIILPANFATVEL